LGGDLVEGQDLFFQYPEFEQAYFEVRYCIQKLFHTGTYNRKFNFSDLSPPPIERQQEML